MPAREIAKALGYPLTSAHALLKSMHELGYVDFDPPSWSYAPSPLVVERVEWVRDWLVRETQILEFAKALNHVTRETVNLSRRVGECVRIVYGLETLHVVGVSVKVGTMMPVTRSLTGLAALACLNKDEQTETLQFVKDQDPEQAASLDCGRMQSVRDELEERGTVVRCDVFISGVGAVCLPVRSAGGGETLVVGIVGPSDRIQDNGPDYRLMVRRLVREHDIDTYYKIRS